MRVLYIASRAPRQESLELEREITELQSRFAEASISAPYFAFYPDTTLEQLPLLLTHAQPDVLHISVHGSTGGLWFRTRDRQDASVSAEALATFLHPEKPPRLVFLNACDSARVAAGLSNRHPGPAAIGMNQPITNEAAIGGGVLFYDRLLSGCSIQAAYQALDAWVRTHSRGGTQATFYPGRDPAAAGRPIYRNPRLIARLESSFCAGRDESLALRIGVMDCPPTTVQTVFFTDDQTFLPKGAKGSLEKNLSEIIRDMPRSGKVWTGDTPWTPNGDFRVAACGITASGQTFSVSALVSEALSAYATSDNYTADYRKRVKQVPAAVQFLKENASYG